MAGHEARRTDASRTMAVWLLACALAVAGWGCHAGSTTGDDVGGWTLDGSGRSDAGPDVGRDAGRDGGGDRERMPIDIRLRNASGGPVWIQKAKNCRLHPPGWIDAFRQGGSDVSPVERCGVCDCSRVRANEMCRACPGACAAPDVTKVADGDVIEWRWAGRIYAERQVDGRACEEPVVPEEGTRFNVRLCWSDQAPDIDGPGGTLKDPTCSDVSFTYGETGVVKVVPEAADPKPKPGTFRLQNRSGQKVRLVSLSDCRHNPDAWVSVVDEKSQLDVNNSCVRCTCEAAASGGCAVCDRVCVPPGLNVLEPGKDETYQWDGVAWRPQEVGGQSCVRRNVYRNGEGLRAKFCWTTDLNAPVDQAKIECEEVEFEYGKDAPITHTISAGDTEPAETTFVLTNDTNQTIRVRKDNGCSYDPPGWVGVSTPARMESMKLKTSCMDCQCEDLRQNGSCGPICRRPCTPRTIEGVAPGQSVRWTWPGRAYVKRMIDGSSCVESRSIGQGASLEAEFCWSPTPQPTGHQVPFDDVKCDRQFFSYGRDGTVRMRVK